MWSQTQKTKTYGYLATRYVGLTSRGSVTPPEQNTPSPQKGQNTNSNKDNHNCCKSITDTEAISSHARSITGLHLVIYIFQGRSVWCSSSYHVIGWEPYDPQALANALRVASVMFRVQLCTTSHSGRYITCRTGSRSWSPRGANERVSNQLPQKISLHL